MKSFVLILIFVALLSACAPAEDKRGDLTICRSFTFVASGRSEITEARKFFYEVAMRRGVDYSDAIRWSGPAEFYFGGGGRLVLDYGMAGDNYLRTEPDLARELTIRWYDEAVIRPGLRTTPCTFAGTPQAYEEIKAQFSSRWQVTKIQDTPRIIDLPTSAKAK
jgi:hypothetical protein